MDLEEAPDPREHGEKNLSAVSEAGVAVRSNHRGQPNSFEDAALRDRPTVAKVLHRVC
jgi:hypothetical protein